MFKIDFNLVCMLVLTIPMMCEKFMLFEALENRIIFDFG